MRKFRKVTATILAVMMTVGTGMFGYKPANVSASQKESEYIIVTKNNKAMKSVEEKYDTKIEKQEQNTDLLQDENVLVSKMTAQEADVVSRDKKVVSVEKNDMVSALEAGDTAEIENEQNSDSEWNLKSIHVDKADDSASSEKIKVALLDSGIDYQEGLDVKERVNLIEDDTEFSPLFEDSSNHGTSIASLLVSNNGEVKGINKNIELYSARILDENKQAPISRVVEGIYWAIDKKVNIISISFGTNQYSEALKQAIDEANANGILVIAAAGNQGENGTDNIEYPAAFENVVAVGSVDSKAELSDFSSTGKEVDVVAPGEAVRATGAFGETMVTSGTSMAVPHVVGVASLLWQKDTSKSKDFVKDLLEESARDLGDKESYGNGLVDYEYADKQYEKAEEQYDQGQDIDIQDNTKTIETYNNSSDEAKVEGTWSAAKHQQYLTDNDVNIPAMKKGAIYADSDDSGVKGMTENPDFHGLYQRRHAGNEEVNYLASYRFMIKIGNEYGKGSTYTAVTQDKIPGLSDTSYSRIRTMMSNLQKKSFFKSYSNANKKAFVFGLAMHTATDAFAHSTFVYKNGWKSITHKDGEVTGADDSSFQKRRFTMAYRIERNNLYRYQGKRADVAVCHDFHAAGDKDGSYYVDDTAKKYYRIANISKYATQVNITDENVIKHYGMINITR